MREIIINTSDISDENEESEIKKIKPRPKNRLYIIFRFIIIVFILSIISLVFSIVFFIISIKIIFWIFSSLTIISLILFLALLIVYIIKETNRIRENNSDIELGKKKVEEEKKEKELDKPNKLIRDLEESKINFINIAGQSCYQSSYLQGFIHFVLPISIKRLNEKRKNKITNLDELKNDNEFNNAVLDTAKEVIQVDKNCDNRVEAKKIYDLEKPFIEKDNVSRHYDHEGLDCQELVNKANEKLIQKNPKKKNNNTELINVIELKEKTIYSEIFKIKIDDKYVYNIVLNFNKKSLDNPNLNIIDLLDNSEQLKRNSYNEKKINEASDIIYIIVDRISSGEDIKKNFTIFEKIYLNNNNGRFEKESKFNSTLYELRFIIVHSYSRKFSGHYTAYCKIREEWYYFNDIDHGNATVKKPPLTYASEYLLPICFYYVKSS